MKHILSILEPQFIKARTIIKDEFEEQTEAMFISSGTVVVGYEINKIKKYCIRMKDKGVVGAYGMTFNMRS